MKKVDSKSVTIRLLEKVEGESIESILKRKYVEEKKTVRDIASELDVSPTTVLKYLREANIKTRQITWI